MVMVLMLTVMMTQKLGVFQEGVLALIVWIRY